MAESAASLASDVLMIADAGPGSGLGHLARCSALAAALGTRGVRCDLLASGAEQPPHAPLEWRAAPDVRVLAGSAPALLLLDSYRLDPQDVRAWFRPRRQVTLHDAGPLPAASDLVLTTDPALAGTQPNVIGGSELTCLGPGFWGLPPAPSPAPRIRRVLVTTGGSDPGGYAVPLAEVTARSLPGAAVSLVRGPQASFPDPVGIRVLERPPSLLGAMLEADLVVSSAGSSLLEALACGTPAVAILLAGNQRPKASALADRGIVRLVEAGDEATLAALLARLDRDPSDRARQATLGQQEIDGYGALRVAYRLAALLRQD